MKRRINITSTNVLIIYFILIIFVFVITLLNYNSNDVNQNTIFLYSWIINIVFIISILSIYFLESKKVGIIIIILLFAFLFNFGQSFFWAFGIHRYNELGKIALFNNYSIPSKTEIFNAMLYSLCCYTYLVFGIILSLVFFKKKINVNSPSKNYIYKFSKYLSYYIIPATFIKIIVILFQSVNHGYTSIYYSNFQIPALIGNAENFFFPIIVGLLIGKDFKNHRRIYFIFSMYTILFLLAGERGNWIYKIVALFWLHYYHYKKIEFKKLISLGFLGFIFLYIVGIMVEIRGIGLANINSDILISILSVSSNPIIKFIFEMGNSLGVTIIVLSLGLSYFPNRSTFLSSILASVSSKIASLFNFDVIFLGNYLSQEILKINYGTGFNLFSEIYINGDFNTTFIYCILFGLLIGLIFRNSSSINLHKNPLKLLNVTSLSIVFFAMFRDSSLTPFKLIMQTGLIYPAVILITYRILNKRKIYK